MLHAVVDLVRARQRSARVVHASTVDLVQDLITALQRERRAALPRRYKQADVLAIDDLHVLAGKRVTQREVGLLLKAAVASGTRVACAAACALEELPVLADACRALPTARVVELRRPGNGEMRRILAAMAEAEVTRLRPQDLAAIAAESRGDVRRAIGALARLQFNEGREGRL